MPAEIRPSIVACIAAGKRSRTITRPTTVPQQPPNAWKMRAATIAAMLVEHAQATLATT